MCVPAGHRISRGGAQESAFIKTLQVTDLKTSLGGWEVRLPYVPQVGFGKERESHVGEKKTEDKAAFIHNDQVPRMGTSRDSGRWMTPSPTCWPPSS